MPNMSQKKNPMPVQDAKLRATNFEEVALGYSPEQARDEALRCLNCKNKPCVSGCPVAVDHPGLFGKGGGRGRRGCLRHYFGVEQPARRVRQGVPAGKPVREVLHARQQGGTGCHRTGGAVCCRPAPGRPHGGRSPRDAQRASCCHCGGRARRD